jgi:hypothetical protein
MRHALTLIASIQNLPGQEAAIKVEDEDGAWRLADSAAL